MLVWEVPLLHDKITAKLIDIETLLLQHEYRELAVRTKAGQLSEKVNRIVRLKQEQLQLLHDLLSEMDRFSMNGRPADNSGLEENSEPPIY